VRDLRERCLVRVVRDRIDISIGKTIDSASESIRMQMHATNLYSFMILSFSPASAGSSAPRQKRFFSDLRRTRTFCYQDHKRS